MVYLNRKNRKSSTVFAWIIGITLTALCMLIQVIGYKFNTTYKNSVSYSVANAPPVTYGKILVKSEKLC